MNSLQKSMAFTPLDPKAGPTGGAGAAWPAPTISFTKTFFADMVREGEVADEGLEGEKSRKVSRKI